MISEYSNTIDHDEFYEYERIEICSKITVYDFISISIILFFVVFIGIIWTLSMVSKCGNTVDHDGFC